MEGRRKQGSGEERERTAKLPECGEKSRRWKRKGMYLVRPSKTKFSVKRFICPRGIEVKDRR